MGPDDNSHAHPEILKAVKNQAKMNILWNTNGVKTKWPMVTLAPNIDKADL